MKYPLTLNWGLSEKKKRPNRELGLPFPLSSNETPFLLFAGVVSEKAQ